MSIFLEQDDVVMLTGRKLKSDQIQQLRTMGIPFYVNAQGRPVVTKSALESFDKGQPVVKKWQPNVVSK